MTIIYYSKKKRANICHRIQSCINEFTVHLQLVGKSQPHNLQGFGSYNI